MADGLPQFASSGMSAFTINELLLNAGLMQVGGLGVGNRLNVDGNCVDQNGVISTCR